MREEIAGAVARGWCHDASHHKAMDGDLLRRNYCIEPDLAAGPRRQVAVSGQLERVIWRDATGRREYCTSLGGYRTAKDLGCYKPPDSLRI